MEHVNLYNVLLDKPVSTATSSMLSDDVDNLLLLCHEHHKLVDDNPEEFTEARLREMKQKHEKMRDKIDFKKIVYHGELIGVLNFNLMIPVEDKLIQKIDTQIRKHDNADTRKKKELLIKELEWCNEYARDLTNTANVLYAKYVSGEKFSAREQCLDFKRMETECKKFAEKRK